MKQEVPNSRPSTQPAMVRSHHSILEGGLESRVANLADASTQELEAAILLRKERGPSQMGSGGSASKKARIMDLPGFGNQRPVQFDLTKEDVCLTRGLKCLSWTGEVASA